MEVKEFPEEKSDHSKNEEINPSNESCIIFVPIKTKINFYLEDLCIIHSEEEEEEKKQGIKCFLKNLFNFQKEW